MFVVISFKINSRKIEMLSDVSVKRDTVVQNKLSPAVKELLERRKQM
jgi:hypothetical protein